jgi:carboxypeptidase Q
MCRARKERPASCEPALLRAQSARAGIVVAAFVIAMFPVRLVADERFDAAALDAIIAEAEQSSEAAEIFYELTDRLGPRLSGSPAHDRAARWAVERFQRWGLAAARIEPFAFGRGWTLRGLTVEMVAPRYMPLIGYAEAWSPPTLGVLAGTPVYVGDRTADEIDALADRLANAIVLAARPQVEFLSEDRPQPAADQNSVQTGNPPFPSPSSATPRAELFARLRAHGAGVALLPSSTEHGTVRVQGDRNTPSDGTPSVVLAAEQYNMLVRLAESGNPVELRVGVDVEYDEDGLDSYNVFAEIPGSDAVIGKDVVLVGAHLDSWHTATGATDNADGVATVMEAMRLLAAIGAVPRRTIRAVLWGGEEQGLLGSRAWVERHRADELARIAVYINDDPGTGKTYGFYMEQSEAAKEIFDAWLEPLRDRGVRRNVIEGIGSTDHVPFVQQGVPAFTTIKDFRHYDVRTRHTNADFADAVDVEDLRQSAIVLAVVAWNAAMRDDPFPRLVAAQSP